MKSFMVMKIRNQKTIRDAYKPSRARSSNKLAATPNRIAICSVGELFGGVERHILGILSGLQSRGVATLLILFFNNELAMQARQQGIEPIILSHLNRSLLATSRKIAYILEQQQIRLVHVHGYKATVICSLARYWHSFAMVKTEHGLPESMAGRPVSALFNRMYHFLDRAATRLARATVCYVTKDLLAHYRRAHSGLRVMVISNGIASIDRTQIQCPPEFCEDGFNLAIIGRVDTVKGHYLAIEAMACNSLPANLHLHIVGLGPCEQDLQTLAKLRGITHRVHFLGFRRNVYDYIAHCHALLIPSLHEGLPYILLEAMALGTPIIASHVGGLAEVLQDNVTALLVPPNNIEALAQAILQLHSDSTLRQRLGKTAQHLQQTHYSLTAMTEHYLAVYRELMLNAGRSNS